MAGSPCPTDCRVDASCRITLGHQWSRGEHLGADCFYDHERHLKPTRRPDVPRIVPALEKWTQLNESDRTEEAFIAACGDKWHEFSSWESEREDFGTEDIDLLRQLAGWYTDHQRDPRFLRCTPEKVFADLAVGRDPFADIPPDPKYEAAKRQKLDEYWAWARRRWDEAGVVYRSTGRGYLLLADEASRLTRAVLEWAHSHVEDPLFLKRTPDEVAQYLQKSGEAVSAARRGKKGRAPRQARAEIDRLRSAIGEATFDAFLDNLIELLPTLGDVNRALEAVAGDDKLGGEIKARIRVLRGLGELLTFVRSPE